MPGDSRQGCWYAAMCDRVMDGWRRADRGGKTTAVVVAMPWLLQPQLSPGWAVWGSPCVAKFLLLGTSSPMLPAGSCSRVCKRTAPTPRPLLLQWGCDLGRICSTDPTPFPGTRIGAKATAEPFASPPLLLRISGALCRELAVI